MLSTISGTYFAGHKPIQASVTPPPPGSGGVNFVIPGSATNGGTSVTNLGTSTSVTTLSAVSPLTVVTSPTPAYMTAPGGFSGIQIPSTDSMTPSSTVAKSITMWLYIPSASVSNNSSSACVGYSGADYDGIYMFAQANSIGNITLRVTTNGRSRDNQQSVPTTYYLPKNQWFMLTYVYLVNNTGPSSVWYNDTLVHSWTHGSDSMYVGPYNLDLAMFGSWAARFNNFMIRDTGYNQAEVTAKFTAERSYYGV